eukprot:CAMPEP_0198214078 /NCGR_PEP_ID=MMETSP1445-20131203/37309_1 /TAXON_ID=36898 /ORGANISM="Pyramimonas sp., Strain CCMP2087" /LENGTH=216 /DNA_ID=CAMNT_0043889059 /DNA_START=205 /DNA_END=855 /DNA_ORIENTATION=+
MKGTSGSETLQNSEEAQLPELVLIGSRRLMQPSPAVEIAQIHTEAFQNRLVTLKQCMVKYGGIGIAGPQIGWYARVFCFGLFKPSERYPALNPTTLPFQYWVNPTVEEAPESRATWFWEGCLSVPDVSGWVGRPDRIVVTGYDENGIKQVMELTGIAARVFQHEFDHLDGTLFPSRVSNPNYLVPNKAFEDQENWAENWPTASARQTSKGTLSWEE